MDFILSNILLPIILALIVGLPLSIYAGFICGRILIFEEIKNKLTEIVYLNSGPFEGSLHIKTSVRNIDTMEIIQKRLEKLGHRPVTKELSELILVIRNELSSLESDFKYCEIRHKREPKATMIEHEIMMSCFERISSFKPSIKQILMPNLKI